MEFLQSEKINALPKDEIQKIKEYVAQYITSDKELFGEKQKEASKQYTLTLTKKLLIYGADLIFCAIVTYVAFYFINRSNLRNYQGYYLDPVFGATPWYVPFVIYGILAVVTIFVIAPWTRRKDKKQSFKPDRAILKRNLNPNFRHQIFKKWFNQEYSDVKIETLLDMNTIKGDLQQIQQKLGRFLPGQNSRIKNIWPGYQLKTSNNVIINTFIMSAVERYSETIGGQTRIYTRESKRFFAIIKNPRREWENVEFAVFPRHESKAKSDLENQDFNRKWAYQTNDDIKIRMLLTPWTQEQLAKKAMNNFALQRAKGISFWTGLYQAKNNIFKWEIKIQGTKNQTINAITRDVVYDINIFQSLMHELSFYKTFVN